MQKCVNVWYGLFFLSISHVIYVAETNDLVKKGAQFVSFGFDSCKNQTEDFFHYQNDVSFYLKSLNCDGDYRALKYQSDRAADFSEYMSLRLKSISAFKKLIGVPEEDSELKQKQKKSFGILLSLNEQQIKRQKEYKYCHKCENKSFDYYNKEKLIDGYIYLEKIPQVALFLEDKTLNQLQGQLNSLQTKYINMLHWMHHELEKQGVYQQAKNLKPVSFMYKGNSIQVDKWDIMHVFMGSLKRGFFTGVHSEISDLFDHFYKRDNNEVIIRGHKDYRKTSTFFPNSWDMKTCVDKAYEALQNIHDIQDGDIKYGCENLLVKGKTKNKEIVTIVVDPAKNLAVSFYLD